VVAAAQQAAVSGCEVVGSLEPINSEGDHFSIWQLSQCSNGIIISMYYFDTRQHHLPHVHVKYQEQEAVISLPDGDVLEGQVKLNKLKLVQAWVQIHKDELMADWELASMGEPVFKIDPLK
jgi:hypothetical protein